jgi:hypothetical protein
MYTMNRSLNRSLTGSINRYGKRSLSALALTLTLGLGVAQASNAQEGAAKTTAHPCICLHCGDMGDNTACPCQCHQHQPDVYPWPYPTEPGNPWTPGKPWHPWKPGSPPRPWIEMNSSQSQGTGDPAADLR